MPLSLIVDIRGKEFIVEFGCGINSGYTGFDRLEEGADLRHKMYKKLLEYYEHIAFIEGIQEDECQSGLQREVDKLNADCESNASLIQVKKVKIEFLPKEEIENPALEKIKDLPKNSCILVRSYGSTFERGLYAIHLQKYLKEIGSTAIVINGNDSIFALIQSKFFYSYCSNNADIATEAIELNQVSEIKLRKIIETLEKKSNTNPVKLVLKPAINSARGYGVIITNSLQIRNHMAFIKKLINFQYQGGKDFFVGEGDDTDVIGSIKPELVKLASDYNVQDLFYTNDNGNNKINRAYSFWLSTPPTAYDTVVIVQEFKASATEDEATGRVVFYYDENTQKLDFVDAGYWKLAPGKQDADSLRSWDYVSDVHENTSGGSRAFTEEEKAEIFALLHPKLLKILNKVTSKSLQTHFDCINNNRRYDDLGIFIEKLFFHLSANESANVLRTLDSVESALFKQKNCLIKESAFLSEKDEQKSVYVYQLLENYDLSDDKQSLLENVLLILEQMQEFFVHSEIKIENFLPIKFQNQSPIKLRNSLIKRITYSLLSKYESSLGYYMRGLYVTNSNSDLERARELNEGQGGDLLTELQVNNLNTRLSNKNKSMSSFNFYLFSKKLFSRVTSKSSNENDSIHTKPFSP